VTFNTFKHMSCLEKNTLACQRHLFDLEHEQHATVGSGSHYLNSAGRGPLLRETCELGIQAMRHKMRPWEMDSGHVEEDVRALFAELVGAVDAVT